MTPLPSLPQTHNRAVASPALSKSQPVPPQILVSFVAKFKAVRLLACPNVFYRIVENFGEPQCDGWGDHSNLTKKSKAPDDETWTYEYDHRNQMTQAQKWDEDPDEPTTETLLLQVDYKYDVHGNRIEKAVDDDGDTVVDTTERYAYDGWKPGGGFIGNENWDIWADLDGSNNLTTRYLRGDMIDQVFARIEEATPDDLVYWLLTDRQGSVRDVTDNSGVVKDTIVYDGFGNITSETDSDFRGRYAWTGRELDTKTGLQYNRARYYDTAIGRLTSQYPLGFEAGYSNLYRYVSNKPTMDGGILRGFFGFSIVMMNHEVQTPLQRI